MKDYYARPRKQVVIELASRGLTQSEIIKETGFPRGTVSSIMSKYKDEIDVTVQYKSKRNKKLNEIQNALQVLKEFMDDKSLYEEESALTCSEQIILHRLNSNSITDEELLREAKKLNRIEISRRSVKQQIAVKNQMLDRMKAANIDIVNGFIKNTKKTDADQNKIANTYKNQVDKKLNKNQLDIVNKFI